MSSSSISLAGTVRLRDVSINCGAEEAIHQLSVRILQQNQQEPREGPFHLDKAAQVIRCDPVSLHGQLAVSMPLLPDPLVDILRLLEGTAR